MPLYFEDATGAKDTVFIGYDPTASYLGHNIDTVFDEGWQKVDTSQFNVFLWLYPSYSPVGEYIITSDSIRKKDISSWPLPYADIGFIKGKMPLILKWEDSLLNSPFLHFPDISPRPKARIDFYCSSGEPPYFNCPIEHEPLSLTNYPTSDLLYPISDSLVFAGSGNYSPNKAIGNITAIVVPHDYHPTNSTNIKEYDDIDVYPNPFVDIINISNPTIDKLEIILSNSLGQIVLKTNIHNSLSKIDLKSIKDGIYIIKLTSRKGIYTKILLKIS